MRIGGRVKSAYLRSRPWSLALMLLVALWLPGQNQGWYRTDTHFYAALGEQAWATAMREHSARALWDLRAGDEPYFNKPPLTYVIHGAFTHAFGVALWSVRLPSLLAAMGAAVATVLAVRRLAGWRIAMLTGLVLATTVEFFRYTRAISLDLWQACFVAMFVAMVVCAMPRAGAGRPRWGMLLLSGVPLGLALLTKPMMALAAPALLAAWLVSIGRGRWSLRLLAPTAVAIAIAAPWHIAMSAAHPDFAAVYFKQQSFERAVHGANGAAPEPWWYYLRNLAEGYWPWLITLVLAAWAIVARRRPITLRDRSVLLLGAIWSIAWIAALSIFGGKSTRYTVIVWPMLSILSAWWMSRRAGGRRTPVVRAMLVWLGPVALAVAIAAAASGVRVHKPRNPAWSQVLDELDRHPGMTLYCTPANHYMAANLVMLGRSWPGMAPDALPRPALIMSRPDEPAPARSRLLVESEDMKLYELSAP